MKQDFVEVDIPQTKMSMAVLKCMKMVISNCTFSYIFLYTHLKN